MSDHRSTVLAVTYIGVGIKILTNLGLSEVMYDITSWVLNGCGNLCTNTWLNDKIVNVMFVPLPKNNLLRAGSLTQLLGYALRDHYIV